jgi:hypothetical protein
MEFGVALDSVGEFELHARWFIDRGYYLELVVDGWR